jgi:hypothetical protein
MRRSCFHCGKASYSNKATICWACSQPLTDVPTPVVDELLKEFRKLGHTDKLECLGKMADMVRDEVTEVEGGGSGGQV